MHINHYRLLKGSSNVPKSIEQMLKHIICRLCHFYYLDREFGLMHIRLQSWFPFEIQVYINGREWLARQLDQQGIAYERYDNCLLRIDDLATAQQLCDRFGHREWARVLNVFARRVNPMLPTIEQSEFGGYYWVINQCEIALMSLDS